MNISYHISKLKKFRFIAILIVVFAGTYFIGTQFSKIVLASNYLSMLERSENNESIKQPKERNIYILYVTDPECQFCNNKKLVSYINSLVKETKAHSTQKEYNIKFMIASLGDVYHSFQLLSDFESIDEISFGNNWQNLAMTKYVVNKGFRKSTPQLLIIEKYNKLINNGSDVFYDGTKNEKVLYHIRSMNQIISFDYKKLFDL